MKTVQEKREYLDLMAKKSADMRAFHDTDASQNTRKEAGSRLRDTEERMKKLEK